MKKVFVGLSGGVDSAVSAALLKERGYDVTCVFIKIWRQEFIECTWKEDRLDAMRIAVALDLPFMEIDLSEDYKRSVIDPMIAGYKKGITPNPDILCNRSIKFGSFLRFAKDNDADFIATGHYARIGRRKGLELLRGNDKAKDQSYFLYLLDESDLSSTIFPVGGLVKSEVRQLAHKFKLPVATKPDSQGLCFVGDVTMKDFLGRYIKLRKGDILNSENKVIGQHDGAALYTIGQRHGFTVESHEAVGAPYYVIESDVKRNVIWVSRDVSVGYSKKVIIEKMHWISKLTNLPITVDVQARYREKPRSAVLSHELNKIVVQFDKPPLVSPGQSLVLYDGDKCLGGGVVSELIK